MTSSLRLVLDLLDPRGRCNRKGLAILAGVLLALEVGIMLVLHLTGLGFEGPVAMTLKSVAMGIAVSASVRRLHDTGRTGWWLLAAVAAIFAWSIAGAVAIYLVIGPRLVVPGSGGQEVLFAITLVPVMAGALWMHFAKGDAGANRYGSAPSGLGLSGPHPLRAEIAPDLLPATA